MNLKWRVLVVCMSSAAAAYAGESPLRSPWDMHPVVVTDAAYQCPAPSIPPHDFTANTYYIDSHHSVIDPALKKSYDDSVAAINEFSGAVVKGADNFQTKGSRAAAQCVASLLESAAKRKSFAGTMATGQASYVQGWSLGSLAVAYLKVRGSGLISEAQKAEITKWLKKLGNDNADYYEKRRTNSRSTDAYNNHLYWAGFAIAAAAIASDDRGLFRWAVNAYKQGVHDIRDDGTLPLEMDRGQRAFHYHLYALAPLIMLAEFGETNGVDLYAERDYAIKRLVARCIAGLDDPSFFQQHAGVKQVTDAEIEAWQISWAQPYTRDFPMQKSQRCWLKFRT